MRKLIDRLDDFTLYMVHKFIKARTKNYGGDALDDSTDWDKWNWTEMRAHLLKEIKEFQKEDDKSDGTINSFEAMKNELADIANLAFVLWARIEYDD